MYGLTKITGFITALSPIHHGGDEKTGSETLFRRNKYFSDGEVVEVPYVSGNAIRGVLRRLIFSDFLTLLGHDLKSIRIYHSFFSGGILESVEGEASGTIDLELRNQLYDLVPPIRLFGTSYLNQTIDGKLQVGLLLPLCEEIRSYLPESIPEKYKGHLDKSVHVFRDIQFQTRKDDLGQPRKEGEAAVQMLFRYETLIPGTVFYHEFRLLDAESIDISCFARVLELWDFKPILGGKSSVGLGKLSLEYDFDESSAEYLSFIEDNKKEIISILKKLK